MNPPETLHVPRAEEEGVSSPTATVILALIAGLVIPGLIAYWMAVDSEVRVIAVVLAVLGFIVLMARPFWGLMFLVGLIYLRPEDTFAQLQGMRLTLWVSLGTMLAAFVHMVLKREPIVRTPLNWMFVGFIACVVASTYRVGIDETAAEDVTRLIIIALLIINLVRTPGHFRTFVTAMLLFTTYLAAYSIYLYLTGQALDHQGTMRAQGTGIFGDPNDLAASIVAGLALALSRLVSTRTNTGRLPYLVLTIFFSTGVLLTNSRGGMVALIVVVIGFFLTYVRYKTFALGLSAVCALALLTFGPSRMTNFDNKEESANNRFSYWESGWYMLQTEPLLGIGFGRFVEENGGMTAHNSFVLCFAELGLTGYFFWIGSLYYCFRRSRKGSEAQESPPLTPTPSTALVVPNLPGTEMVRAVAAPMPTPPLGPIEDPQERSMRLDLLGSRLALAGYLAAAFWISRTYVPVLYVMIALPIAAQVALARDPHALALTTKDQFRDSGRIMVVCLLSIAFIRLVTKMYL